jgi:hypothetical protein
MGPFWTGSSMFAGDHSLSFWKAVLKMLRLKNIGFLLSVPVSNFKAHLFVLWL